MGKTLNIAHLYIALAFSNLGDQLEHRLVLLDSFNLDIHNLMVDCVSSEVRNGGLLTEHGSPLKCLTFLELTCFRPENFSYK